MQSHFIRTCAAIGTIGLVGGAYAGDTTRFDVGWSDIEIFFIDFAAGETPANIQNVDTADPGRYFGSLGWSNVDVDVCWNTGSSFSGWASEVAFDIQMSEADVTAWFFAAPFAGDDTGSDVEGACSNRQALAEVDLPLAAFTYAVDASGTVGTGMSSTWNEGLGLRHSEVNTADFYFTLAGDAPGACSTATGECGEVHPEPGCNDVGCCSLVCDPDAGGDAFCCDSSWDSSCVAIAIALCNIYEYTCDAPSSANDCATDPVVVSNGGSYATDTLAANYDGPTISCAAEGGPNVWYLIEVTDATDQQLTASTCDAADYDTALTLWDMGTVGTPLAGENLDGAEVACNDDGGGCADFTSILSYTMTAGRQYLLSVSGYQGAVGTATLSISWEEPAPQIDPMVCDAPGPDTYTQTIAGATLQDNGVACAAGGLTVENGFARLYTAADLGDGFTLDCMDFGVVNSGSYVEGRINVYRSANGTAGPFADLSLLGSVPYGCYPTAGAEFDTAVFDGGLELDLTGGAAIIIELEIDPSLDGFAALAGGTVADVTSGTTYIRSGSCGITEFTPYADIGFDNEWFVDLNGTAGGGGTPCPGDFNDDGVVNGADFGAILAAWGPCPGCPEDLNGDGVVGGADVGLLLSVWGACP